MVEIRVVPKVAAKVYNVVVLMVVLMVKKSVFALASTKVGSMVHIVADVLVEMMVAL